MNVFLSRVQQGALAKLNISSLNAMQNAAIGHCRKNSSMVLLSPTGTGKTLAFLLPLLERLNHEEKGIQALVVLPTRELAKQVFEVWRSMSTPFQMIALYGGRPMDQEAASFGGSSPAVVVGTPGRLLDHLGRSSFSVDKCSLLVIDEFDKCLEMGFRDEMSSLIEAHREIAPLKLAKDSVKLDTSELDIDGVMAEMKRIIGQKIPL